MGQVLCNPVKCRVGAGVSAVCNRNAGAGAGAVKGKGSAQRLKLWTEGRTKAGAMSGQGCEELWLGAAGCRGESHGWG